MRNAEHVGQKCVLSHKNGFIEFCTRARRTEADMKGGGGGGERRAGAEEPAFVHMTRLRSSANEKRAYSILALIEKMDRAAPLRFA